MNVHCPGCRATYFVDETKVPQGGGRLTCRQCGTKWEIFRPDTVTMRTVARDSKKPAAPAPQPVAAPPPVDPPTVSRTRKARGAATSSVPAVTCPKCGHSFAPAPEAKPAPPAGARKVILLVEDQKYFTEITREALGAEYRTVSVGTREEAMKVLESESPVLMILDLSLARGQDGRDLLKALPNKDFPVLIFTARDETELYGDAWEELKRLGADDIVHKGMNVGDELKRKVASLLAVK
ncbi:MAG: zinc-ribbon domain-containing protein [Acidobacteria bacterium]|nr:zinc-ribbon domain-containing protein [Acidobacteriota bacterium]